MRERDEDHADDDERICDIEHRPAMDMDEIDYVATREPIECVSGAPGKCQCHAELAELGLEPATCPDHY